MSEITARYNHAKALDSDKFEEANFHSLLAIYQQNETIIELLKEIANKTGSAKARRR